MGLFSSTQVSKRGREFLERIFSTGEVASGVLGRRGSAIPAHSTGLGMQGKKQTQKTPQGQGCAKGPGVLPPACSWVLAGARTCSFLFLSGFVPQMENEDHNISSLLPAQLYSSDLSNTFWYC